MPTATTPRDLYADLELRPTATAAEIRSAYLRLALARHPDRNPTDSTAAERFRRTVEAYQVLGNPAHRVKYDQSRAQGGQATSEFWRSQFPNMVTDVSPTLRDLRAAWRARDFRSVAHSSIDVAFTIHTIFATWRKARAR